MNPRFSRLLSSLGPLLGLAFVIGLFSLSNEVRQYFLTGGNFKIILTPDRHRRRRRARHDVDHRQRRHRFERGLGGGPDQRGGGAVGARPGGTGLRTRHDPGSAVGGEPVGEAKDPVAKFLFSKLGEETRRDLAAFRAAKGAEAESKRPKAVAGLVRDLNAVIVGPSIYQEERFARVVLRPETRALSQRKPLSPDQQARLNRRLLEDAFPTEMRRLPGFGLVVGVASAVSIAVGGLIGLINGVTIAGFRMMPFIVTLGMMGIVRGAAKWMGNNQTVNPPASPVNELMALTDPHELFPLPLGVWVAIALAAIMAVVLRRTVFGRHIFAIGSNEATARLCGIRVPYKKTVIYALAGLFFGLAGLMQFSRLTQGDPSVAIGLELDIIASVVIGGASLSGGTGSIAGSMIGALMMAVLRNGSNQMGWPTYMQEIIIGIVIVLAVGLDSWRQARLARQTG
jgi:ribose/xylose/arabinose/galactoside ABC-type transport system permease subunit